MSSFARRSTPLGTGLLLVVCALFFLVRPAASPGQVPSASVTVCKVQGSAAVPDFAQVTVSVDQVAAYLNQHPGSFVGSCPASDGGGSGQQAPPLTGAVTVCRVSGTASAPILSQVVVGADQIAAYLNENRGSFAGPCPVSAGGGNAGGSDGTGPLNAVVTVCRVTGDVRAPGLAQLNLALDEVAAFLNQNERSFVGACPGRGGTVTQGPGRILGIPAGAALSICRVVAGGEILRFLQVNVEIERVAAFLNQNPGSFVGLCPSAGDPNGTIGNEPLGYVTICRVTGDATSPLIALTLRANEVAAYLGRPGTVLAPSNAGCPRMAPGGGDPTPPSTTSTGESSTVTVRTTPNTVVTARGAGVNQSTRSDSKGRAKVRVKPSRPGIVTIRATSGRVAKRIGVAAARQSGGNLTG